MSYNLRNISRMCALSLVLSLSNTTPSYATDQNDKSALAKEFLNAYENSFPNTKPNDIKNILSEDRHNNIVEVRDCVNKIDGYAGLEVRHEPEYLVAVKFRKQAKKKLKSCTSDPIFLGILAPRSLDSLKQLQDRILENLSSSGIDASFEITLRNNRMNLIVQRKDVAKTKAIVSSLGAPKRSVRVFSSKNHPVNPNTKPSAPSVFAGLRTLSSTEENPLHPDNPSVGPGLSGCTTGFSVMHTTNVKGITTAGHCKDNNAFVNGLGFGVSLPTLISSESNPDSTHVNTHAMLSPGGARIPGVDLQFHANVNVTPEIGAFLASGPFNIPVNDVIDPSALIGRPVYAIKKAGPVGPTVD